MAIGLGPMAVGANEALQQLLARRFLQEQQRQKLALQQRHETGLESDRAILRRQQEEAIKAAADEKAARAEGLRQTQAEKDASAQRAEAFLADPTVPAHYKDLLRAHRAGLPVPGEAFKSPDLVPIQTPSGVQYGPKVPGAIPGANPDESFELHKKKRDYDIQNPLKDPGEAKLTQVEQQQRDAANTILQLAPSIMKRYEDRYPGIAANPDQYGHWSDAINSAAGKMVYKSGVSAKDADINQDLGAVTVYSARSLGARLPREQYNDIKMHLPQAGFSPGENYKRLKGLTERILPATFTGTELGHPASGRRQRSLSAPTTPPAGKLPPGVTVRRIQ